MYRSIKHSAQSIDVASQHDVVEDCSATMGHHELRHSRHLFLGGLIGWVLCILHNRIDGILHRAATPKEGRLVIVVCTAHAASLLAHLAIAVVAHLEYLRHHKTADDVGGCIGDGFPQVVKTEKLGH